MLYPSLDFKHFAECFSLFYKLRLICVLSRCSNRDGFSWVARYSPWRSEKISRWCFCHGGFSRRKDLALLWLIVSILTRAAALKAPWCNEFLIKKGALFFCFSFLFLFFLVHWRSAFCFTPFWDINFSPPLLCCRCSAFLAIQLIGRSSFTPGHKLYRFNFYFFRVIGWSVLLILLHRWIGSVRS